MSRHILSFALVLGLSFSTATAASAQHQHQNQHQHPRTSHPSAHAAATENAVSHTHSDSGTAAHERHAPCPLHLTITGLTPVQERALEAIRTAHKAEVQALKAQSWATESSSEMAPDSLQDAMRASMHRAMEAMRAVLGPDHRGTVDAAVMHHHNALAAPGKDASCGCCTAHKRHASHTAQ